MARETRDVFLYSAAMRSLNSMKESGIKLDEMPLGAVTAERVDRAREIIAQIEAHLQVCGWCCSCVFGQWPSTLTVHDLT